MARRFFFIFLPFLLFSFNPPREEKAETIHFIGHSFDIYRIDLQTDTLHFFLKDENNNGLRSISNLKDYLKRSGYDMQFATNGGMYLKDGSPQGLYIEEGKTIIPLNTDTGYGNFYLKPNGVFFISGERARIIQTEEYEIVQGPIDYATQSGPLLLINRKMHPAFREGSDNLYIRSGVGLVNDHEMVFAISNQPVNFYDFALLFKEKLGCYDALYLDGAISKMYIKSTGREELDGQFGCMIAHITSSVH